MALTTGACQRNQPPPTPPPEPEATGVSLRYEAPAAPLMQHVELQLTHTRLGLYVEAGLDAQVELTLLGREDVLRTGWTVLEVTSLELDGTAEPGAAEQLTARFATLGKGAIVTDAHGLFDETATDADPINAVRMDLLAAEGDAAVPAAGVVLVNVLADQLRLPRLPPDALELDEPMELEEETETVVTDADLVLPTTTVYRYTLRKVETVAGTRLAEIELAVASVAVADPLPPDEAAKKKKGKKKKGKKKKPQEPEEPIPAAELHSKSDGVLMFDLDRGLPVSLELSHTETFRVGDQELEQSFQLRSTFTAEPPVP